MNNSLDHRTLPTSWPASLRAATEGARGIRDNVVLKALVEGYAIQQSTGSDCGFTEFVNQEYVRKHLGDAGLFTLDKAMRELADDPTPLVQLASGPAAWRTSPLTVGLTLTKDLEQLYAPAPHIRLISDAIVDAFAGRGPKAVIISLPSRLGKSETAGRRTLEFFFSNYPGLPAIYVSASDDLSMSLGRLVRGDLQLHSERFGFKLAEDSASAGRFNTDLEGTLISVGIAGQVLGRGAALMIVDDLYKSSEQASSASYRDIVWSLWLSALQTRLQSGAVLIGIGTRFHSKDWIGRCLNGHGDVAPLDARYVRLPALAEEDNDEVGRRKGEALPLGPVQVPGFGYTREDLELRRITTGEEFFQTNYQQNPIDELHFSKAYRFVEADHTKETAWDLSKEILCGIDFNISPMSICLAQVSEVVTDPLRRILSNERYYFVEVHDSLALDDCTSAEASQELIERLRRISEGTKLKLRITGDASGNARHTSASTVEDTDWQSFRDAFSKVEHLFSVTFDIRSQNPSVRSRVNKVNTLLSTNRLIVNPRCTTLIHDLKSVTWAKDTNGNVRDTLSKKDPKLTHQSDALGYLVWVIGSDIRYGEMPGIAW